MTQAVWNNRQGGTGAGVDSFYEYLLKAYVLFGKSDPAADPAAAVTAAVATAAVAVVAAVYCYDVACCVQDNLCVACHVILLSTCICQCSMHCSSPPSFQLGTVLRL